MEPGPSSAQATLAHYWDDVSNDTLAGAQEIPAAIVESTARVAITTVFAPLAILVFVYWVGHYAIGWRRSQREKTFQRELRRRHGIPDDDHRPFNVAYQAASIAARNSVRQSLSSQAEHPQSSPALQNNTPSATIMEGFRPQPRSRPPIPSFPGQPPVRVPSGSFNFGQPQPPPVSGSDSSRAFSQLPHAAASASWGPRYSVDNFRATSVPTVPTVSSRSAFAIAAASGSRRTSALYAPGVNTGTGDRRSWSSAARPVTTSRSTGNVSQGRVRKRLYLTADEEADEQQSDIPNDKRSRTAGWGSEAMIDGDNEPLWAQSYPIESKPVSDQHAPQTGKSKGKRLADDGEGDLRIGGKRRQTKSTKAHRPKPEVVQETRGTKRDRKDVDTASVLNDVMPVHKRGRAGDHNPDLTMVEEEEDAEEEEDDPTVSRDPMCGGRRIGQKWTANGQEYMVGANGDRLRFTTVKESRKRYYMPTDSKHADNLHKVDVFVEKWLTEEQYAKAKADGLLAWQENENLPTPSKLGSPEKALEGKENQDQDERPRSISTTAITVSRIPQAQRAANTIWNTPGQSPLQTSSPHTNPFNTPPSATTPQSPGPRRMRYSMGTLPATSMNSSRLIPTWEKQEREANALKILRERRAAETAKTAPAPTSAPALAPASNPAPVPAITFTASSTEPTASQAPAQAAVKPSLFSLAAPASKPADPSPTPAPTNTPAAANPFSFAAPKKNEAPKPLFSATAAPVPAATTATTTTPSPFAPQPATSAPSTSGFGANPNPSPATASPFGALSTTAPAAPATASPFGAPTSTAATKPSPFGFTTQSNTPKPADPAPAPASTPFGTTPFGGAAAAAPAPSPFGATPAGPSPAATKPMGGFSFAPTPAAAPSSAPATATASGSSLFSAPAPKPAATGFSFNSGNANTNGASSAKPAGNAFSFGREAKPAAAPASTGFGNVGAGSSNGFGNTPGGQSTNVFGNNTASGSSGFGNGFGSNGNAGASASPFAFGAPKTTGATTSGFGSQPAQAAATPAFGSPPAAPASSSFKFGEANAASSTPTTTTGSGFQFGAPKPTLSIPQTTPFGAPPSATPTTASGTGFSFGASASAAAAASPATPSKPLFSLGAAASPVLGTRQISTSKRVQRAMSKPPQ